MSRTVSVPSGAKTVCYRDISELIEQEELDFLIEDIQQSVISQWPSFYEVKEWIDNENRVVAKNKFAKVGISEYCGLASIWLVANEEYEGSIGLQENFLNVISEKFEKFFGELIKIGTFSNGEAVYKKKEV